MMAVNERHYRINGEITVPRVRLVDGTGGQLGVVTREDAISKAKDAGLDLVEVAPEADPPVCRLMDFGKFRYTQQKHEQVARKRQHIIKIKEVKFHVKIAPHDYQVKVRAAERFLVKGDKVKLVVAFRGREVDHSELGIRILDNLIRDLAGVGVVEFRDEGEEKIKSVIITPKIKTPIKGKG